MSIKILVVDDNSDILANVAEYLEMKGWIVECSLTSADAWERVHRSDIDLMILDVGLPGMDGMTLCRRLRSEGKTLPILMLTARDAIDDRVDGLMAGADDYLVKPFALRELAARVETLLRRTLGATNSTLTVGPLTHAQGHPQSDPHQAQSDVPEDFAQPDVKKPRYREPRTTRTRNLAQRSAHV